MKVAVVVAADVLTEAVLSLDPALVAFPTVPPFTGSNSVDVLGAFLHSKNRFSFVTSDEILEQVMTALAEVPTPFDFRDRVSNALVDLAHRGQGAVLEHTPSALQTPQISANLRAALRAASTNSLGPQTPRVVVTNEDLTTIGREFTPRGIPWSGDNPIVLLKPAGFLQSVGQAFRRRDI